MYFLQNITSQKVLNTASGYQFSRPPPPQKNTVFLVIPSINHFSPFRTILLVKLRYLFLSFVLVKAQIYFAESSSSYTFLPFKIIIFGFHLLLVLQILQSHHADPYYAKCVDYSFSVNKYCIKLYKTLVLRGA